MVMAVFVFLFGSIIGSFLNVCIYRIPMKQSIAFPPSHCPSCSTNLKAIDLVPILSFLLRGGKCRYCSTKIAYQYPLIEMLNGFIYLFIYLKFGYGLKFLAYAVLCSALIVVALIDYHHQIIPDKINLFLLICGLIFHITNFSRFSTLYSYGYGFLVGGGFLFLVAVLSKGAMGGGDIKLMAVLGLWLGLKLTILNLFLSFFIGGLISTLLILFKIKGRKDMIPFGPFIVLATIVTVFYGNDIINYYMNTFIFH